MKHPTHIYNLKKNDDPNLNKIKKKLLETYKRNKAKRQLPIAGAIIVPQ